MMKTIDILYRVTLTQVQGVNYVHSSFIQGQDYFKNNGLQLGVIVTPSEIFECNQHKTLDIIGDGQGTTSFKTKRIFRKILKVVFSSKLLIGALVKYYFNIYKPAKTTAKRYLALRRSSEYILFQGVFEAYYFFKMAGDKLKNTKTVYMSHGDGIVFSMTVPVYPAIFRYKWIRNILFYNKYYYCVERLNKIVFLSSKATEACKDIDDTKKTFIYNGEEDLPDIQLKHTNEIIEIVCVGSMNYRKGQDKLIQAIDLLNGDVKNRIHVNLIGGGPQMSELQKYVSTRKMDDLIKFWGVRKDVSELLKSMDLFCLPSANEGMPMVIIEALRQGLYILGTDTGGIREMITPEFGKIITRDPNNIADTITYIITHDEISDNARQAARKFYEDHFTLKQNIDNFSTMFNQL